MLIAFIIIQPSTHNYSTSIKIIDKKYSLSVGKISDKNAINKWIKIVQCCSLSVLKVRAGYGGGPALLVAILRVACAGEGLSYQVQLVGTNHNEQICLDWYKGVCVVGRYDVLSGFPKVDVPVGPLTSGIQVLRTAFEGQCLKIYKSLEFKICFTTNIS